MAETSRPQSFLFGCELKSTKKEFTFEAEDDGADHMLVLRSVCLGGDATDEMHSVEVQSLDSQGRDVVATIATLKPSVQPSLALSGLDVEPPVTFKLKAGSGPIYISGQHYLEAMSDIDDDDEDDIDETPIVPSKKRARVTPKSQPMVSMKKPKLGDAHADDEDDDDDYEDDDFEVDDEEEEEEDEVLSKGPMRIPSKKSNGQAIPKPSTPGKQNLKASGKQGASEAKVQKAATPLVAKAGAKMTESGKKEGKRTPPKSPKTPLTLEDVKTKMKLQMDKGIKMPKKEDKFVNHIKNCFKIEDQKVGINFCCESICELFKMCTLLLSGFVNVEMPLNVVLIFSLFCSKS
uniref:Nucleophosmin n=1 Tax=Eptatretus burgeri TaxID=7764 RepID=A0A8C4QUB1_EPTBU